MFNNELWQKPSGGAGADFYTQQISKSCRFIGSATGDGTNYMYHTRGTPTNVDKCTISAWVKRGKLGIKDQMFTGSGLYGGNYSWLGFNTANEFYFHQAGSAPQLESNALFRDTSAWYHIVIANDSTQATAANRNKVYINGVQYTDWGDFETYSALNGDFYMNTSGYKLFVGSGGASAGNSWLPYEGLIAEYVFIDGTQYAASDFGETKNGAWIPKDPSGLTFGNNGAYLKFESSSDLGNDSSGNNNDFTVTAIAAHDQMLDSPTFGSGSSGNFATIGGLEKDTGGFTFSECNLKYAVSTNNRGFIFSQGVPESGKYYWEVRVTQYGGTQDHVFIGVCEPDKMRGNLTGSRGGADVSGAGGYTVDNYHGAAVLDGTTQSADAIGTARSVPQTFGFAIDRDNNTFKWTYDGSSYSSTYTIPSSGVLAPYIGSGGGSNTASGVFNFGADSTFAGLVTAGGNADENGYGNFSLAVPSGYLALCAANLPTAAAVDPAQTDDDYPQELFFMSDYVGNLTNRTITTENQPDLLMLRHWTTGQNWYTLDSTRVITDNKYILTNTTALEDTLPQANITSVGATSVGISSGTWLNSTGSTYQMWMWRANGGTTSSGSGDLTSTHQVDPSGGFSIVKAVGDGGSGDKTVSHGLSAAPTCILAKNLDATYNWDTYFSEGVTAGSGMRLNTNETPFTGRWGTMSSSIFTVKDNYTWDGTNNYIYYCFTNIEGYIKSGSYEGNGDADGSFVYTGFRPAFIMTKSVDSTSDWFVFDDLRVGYNVDNNAMAMNDALAETTTDMIDILSNGFKLRIATDPNVAETYVFLAMAENPFQYSLAR